MEQMHVILKYDTQFRIQHETSYSNSDSNFLDFGRNQKTAGQWIHSRHPLQRFHLFSSLLPQYNFPQRIPTNQPITLNNGLVTNDDKIVTFFGKQFTTIVPHTSDPEAHRVIR